MSNGIDKFLKDTDDEHLDEFAQASTDKIIKASVSKMETGSRSKYSAT